MVLQKTAAWGSQATGGGSVCWQFQEEKITGPENKKCRRVEKEGGEPSPGETIGKRTVRCVSDGSKAQPPK
jgi:hypothetical protein